MPMELRKLVFSIDELKAAAMNHCLHLKMAIPHGPIREINVQADPDATLVMYFDIVKPSPRGDSFTLSREHVMAALIRYCKAHDIPLPRMGQKLLQPQEDNTLAMLINIHWIKK